MWRLKGPNTLTGIGTPMLKHLSPPLQQSVQGPIMMGRKESAKHYQSESSPRLVAQRATGPTPTRGCVENAASPSHLLTHAYRNVPYLDQIIMKNITAVLEPQLVVLSEIWARIVLRILDSWKYNCTNEASVLPGEGFRCDSPWRLDYSFRSFPWIAKTCVG